MIHSPSFFSAEFGWVCYAKPHPFLLYEACRQTGTVFTSLVVIGRVKVWHASAVAVGESSQDSARANQVHVLYERVIK